MCGEGVLIRDLASEGAVFPSNPGSICFLPTYYCMARQCLSLRRKFMQCYIIKPAQSLLMKHLVIGQR